MHAKYIGRDEKKYFDDLNLLLKLITNSINSNLSVNIKFKISYDLYSDITFYYIVFNLFYIWTYDDLFVNFVNKMKH